MIEIISLIKNLSTLGITMIIVSHDMQLVKSVSTKVFYMDEKSIYETGTVEEIFENAQKIKTKEFVLNVQTLKYELKKDFDYYDFLSQNVEFLRNYYVDKTVVEHITLLNDEIIHNSLIKILTDNENIQYKLLISSVKKEFKIVYMYSKINEKLFSEIDYISKSIILGYSSNVSFVDGKIVIEVFRFIILPQIIRNRTFDALFPLITVSLIYFLMDTSIKSKIYT